MILLQIFATSIYIIVITLLKIATVLDHRWYYARVLLSPTEMKTLWYIPSFIFPELSNCLV
jgi:hypothetical protein